MGFTAIAQSSSCQSPSQMSVKTHLHGRPLSVSQCKGLLHNAYVHKNESIIYRTLLRLLDYVRGTNHVRVQELFGHIVDTRSCSRSVIQSEIDELNSLIDSNCQIHLNNFPQGDDESYEVHLHFYKGAEEYDDRIILRRSIAGRVQEPEEFLDDSFKFSHLEPLTRKYSISKPSLIVGLHLEIPQFVIRTDEVDLITHNCAAGSIQEIEVLSDQLYSQPDDSDGVTPNDWGGILKVEESDAPFLPKPNEANLKTQSSSVDPVPYFEEGITDEQVMSKANETKPVAQYYRADSTPEVEDTKQNIKNEQAVSSSSGSEHISQSCSVNLTSEFKETTSVEESVSQSNESESFTQGYGSAPITEDDNFDGSQLGAYQVPLEKDKIFESWKQALNNPSKKLSKCACSFDEIKKMSLKKLRNSDSAKSMLFVSLATNKNEFRLNKSILELLSSGEHRNSVILLKENINLVLEKLGIEVVGFTATIMDKVPTECNWNKECISISGNNQSDLNLLMSCINTLRQIGFHALAQSVAVKINNHRSKNGLMPFSCISLMAKSPLICVQGTESHHMYDIDTENENDSNLFS